MKKNNYYENIDTENDLLLKYISSSEKKLNDLSSFFNEIYSNSLNLNKSVTKNLSSFFDTSKISEVITKTDQNMIFFYQTSLLFLNNLSEIIEKFNHIIINPLNDFKKNYIKQNNKIKNDFLSLLKDLKKEKRKLINYQKEYYDSLIDYINIKNNYHSLSNNKNKKEQIGKIYNEMAEKKSIMKIKKQLYKYKIGAINILYKNFDIRYKKYYKLFETNEKNKLIFLYNTFRLFSMKINKLTDYLNDIYLQINSKINNYNVEEDKNIIKEEFNYIGRYINSDNIFNDSNTIQRFNKEIYMPYNMANMNYINNFFNKNEILKSKSSKSIDDLFEKNKSKTMYIKDDNLFINDLKIDEEKEKNIIQQFYECLYANEILPYDLIFHVVEKCKRNVDFCDKFIDRHYMEYKDKYFLINKEKNIKNLSYIFLNIFYIIKKNKSNINNENNANNNIYSKYNELYIKILRIGQLIYFIYNNKYKKQNIFLCGLINKYFEFQKSEFWENLLLFNIENKLKKLYTKIETNINKDEANNNKTINGKHNNLQLINNFEKVIFLKDQNKKNDENSLSDNIKNNYLKKAFNLFHQIMLEFIPFLINYNYGCNNSISLIKNICLKYNIKNELINFYISYITTFSYSSKQYSQNLYHKITKKLEEIKLNNNIPNRNKNNKNNKNNNKNLILTEQNKIIIILNISKYLDNNEKIKIIKLNKKIYEKIHKKIYKQILDFSDKFQINKTNNKTHINIWKNFLNYKDIKKKYPYEIYKKKAFSKKHINYEQTDFYIIDLDCQRTLFENNKIKHNRSHSIDIKGKSKEIEEKNNIINNYNKKSDEMKRICLNNILKTLISLNREQTYCQGMNFIAAFLLRVLNEKEEDTFYFMTGLFKCTTYPKIFHDNLFQLTLYFNIFNHLLYIFIPNLYYYFKNNNVIPNYYLSSCFITLFTNYANKEKNINLFIKIFDFFIIDGWKGIFNILLEILWNNEEKIINLKNEDLLHYLNGNLVKDFMENYQDYKCFEFKTDRKVSNKLIKNIEDILLSSTKLGISIE